MQGARTAAAYTPVFASGKFDQFNRRPFSAIIDMVAQLVDSTLTQVLSPRPSL